MSEKKDLEELAKSFKAAAEGAEKLTSAERRLADVSDDATSALGRIAVQALKSLNQVAALEAKIAALTSVATPLKSALSGVNEEMTDLAVLSKDGAKFGDAYAKGLKEAEKAASGAAKQIDALGKAQKDGGSAAKLSADEAKKLGGALRSAFDSLASGADPFKVFLDQGPAIADVFGQAAKNGIGLKGVLLGVGEAALPLAGVGLAAAAIAAPFALGAAEINKANGDITKGLGLTQEELSKVTHKTVTMGDVFQATLNVIGRHLTEGPIAAGLQWLATALQDALKNFVMNGVDRVADLVGFWVAAYDTIVNNWRNLPAALGAIFTGAVNLAIRHIESLVNGAFGGINVLIAGANKIPGVKLTPFKPIDIPELQMIGGKAAQAVSAGFEKKQSEVRNGLKRMVSGAFKEVGDESLDVARKIAFEQGKSGGAKTGSTTNISNRSTGGSSHSGIDYGEISNVAVGVGDVAKPQVESLVAYKPDVPGKLNVVPQLDEQNMLLSNMISHFEELNKLAPQLGDSLEKAFGGPGKALTGVISAAATLGKKLAEISLEERDPKNKDDAVKFARQRVDATVSGFAEMSIAAKGFFDKNYSGYAALQSVEKAYRAWQFAQQVQAMAREAADTVRSVANSLAKGTASTAAGAAKMFEVLGPFAFPAVAAMVALLAGLGLSSGGGGGDSVPGANDMKARQDAQGSGSILGDSKAKSESLEKALTHAQAYENKDLEYGNAMVRSLKSIDDQIGAVAAALAKAFGAGGMLSAEGLNLGKTGSTPTLSNLGFSKSTTRTLQDQGIQFDAATLGAILEGGLSGSTYQQVLETTKKKAFGITTSSKSKVITETGALDGDFLDQITKLITSLGKGVTDAAGAIKATGVEEALASFKVDLGKLSFKDMTGTQIEEALNAIFGKLGDDMAKAAVPAIAQFQKVGEGAFETLVRVARQYEVIDTTLKSVGMTFATVGVASLEARERLVDLVGGLDNLTDQAAFFAEHFLSDDERLKPVQDSVAAELKRLGLSPDLTREGFKDLVLKQNVSNEDGAKLYAALMALAPAFDKVATAAENARAAVEDKRASIQDQIDELTLSSGALLAKSRAKEMEAVEALDASLAPLLKTLWGLQDAAEAAKLATDRSNMYADLLEAQGRSEEAKALRRANALAAITDPIQKQYQEQIWAAEDAAAKVAAARDVLTQAYQREHDALQATKDKFADLSKSLRGFSASLSGTIAGADLAGRYRTTRQSFLTTASLARLGDPDAMGRLQAEGEAFTAASRDYVSTSQDYLRDVGLVRAAVDEAADTADRQVSIAEAQLEALDASVQGLIQVNASVVSVREAIAGLQAANQAAAAAGVVSVGGVPVNGASSGSGAASTTLTQAQKDLNNASWNWGLVNSMAGRGSGNADSTDPEIQAVYTSAARYQPGYMDIVNTQGIDAANALVAQGKLSFFQSGALKYATGGSFEVGGSGPPDSKLFNLALSPGEAVNVQRADQKNDKSLINELRALRDELADLRATSARIATSNDKMERTLTNVTEGGRAMQTQAAA